MEVSVLESTITDLATTISSDLIDTITGIMPILAGVLVLAIGIPVGIKLVKKFTSKV